MMTGFANYPSLRGRSVLITGGASGIGASIVEHFVAQEAKVGIIDLDRQAAASLLERLGARAALCRFVPADLRDIAALQSAIAALRQDLGGPFTVLLNNAARDDRHEIEAVTPGFWDERMATNLRHQFFAAQAVIPDMIDAGGGSIVNMSSTSFVRAVGHMPAYLTAKSAVIGLTRALARDLGKHHIRANAILPGWIMTERQVEKWLTPEAEVQLMRDQCIPEKLHPPDVARLVLWLAADDSRLITAQSFTVDAGWT
jgi:NAD(P)-dependent dehydrogenase (short-subunit alcohol dehydrogenase family)